MKIGVTATIADFRGYLIIDRTPDPHIGPGMRDRADIMLLDHRTGIDMKVNQDLFPKEKVQKKCSRN
jgi:hypothetical protein